MQNTYTLAGPFGVAIRHPNSNPNGSRATDEISMLAIDLLRVLNCI
jgi:hypothetical protein